MKFRVIKRKAFSLIVPLIFMYSLVAALLFAAHFVVQRKKAIQNLRDVERELHIMHESRSEGPSHWRPIFNEQTPDPILDELKRDSVEGVELNPYAPPIDNDKRHNIHADF